MIMVPKIWYLYLSSLTHLICAFSFRFLKLKNPEHEVPLRDVRVHMGIC
jgi:hypothetical protein